MSNFYNRPTPKKKKIIETQRGLKRLANKLKEVEEFAFDTETNTLRVNGDNSNFLLVGISISWGFYDNYYIPVNHRLEEDFYRCFSEDDIVKYLKEPFEREDVRIIGQNLKFDMHVMKRVDIEIKTTDLFDTMLASWLCNENTPNGLKENSVERLNIQQTHFKEVIEEIPKEVKKEFGLKANQKATADLTRIDDLAPYAIDDAFYTYMLYLGFLEELEKEGMDKIFFTKYIPYLRILYDMEEQGATVDIEHLEQMQKDITEDIEALEYQIYELAGVEFNIGSNAQLAELFFGYQKDIAHPKESKKWSTYTEKERERKIKEWENKLVEQDSSPLIAKSFNFKVISETPSGAPQTNVYTFRKISKMTFKNSRKMQGVEIAKLIMEYSKLKKLKTAFIDGMFEQLYDDGKVHPNFKQLGTDSGRLSCSSPNLQQLPKADEEDKYQIRSLFIGSVNPKTNKRRKIIAIDFSNLEMRVLAHFSKDKNLLRMFENGEDTHGSTAVNMFELPCDASEVKKQYPHLRQAAKVINFLLMYGGSAPTLYENLKEDPFSPIDLGEKHYLEQYHKKNGVEVAQVYIDKYFTSYSGVADFIRKQKKFAHKNGYVWTLIKRKRRLPDINSKDYKMSSYCERLAVNACIQGSAADITNSAQIRISKDERLKELGSFMILQVHDEIVLEADEDAVQETIEICQRYMSHPFGDNVELNVAMLSEADSGDSYAEAK